MIDRPVARVNNVISRNEFRHQNEPGGGTGSTLWHAKPFVESAWGAKGSQGGSVRVGRQLNKPREKAEQWENRATTEGVKHFVEYLVDLVQLLVVNSKKDSARFLRDTYEGAQPWRYEMLDEAGTYVESRMASTVFIRYGHDWIG